MGCWGLVVLLSAGTNWAVAQRQPVDCTGCHAEQAQQFQSSIHRATLRCQQCHGGKDVYEISAEQARACGVGGALQPAGTTRPGAFDHGDLFRGKPRRLDIPELCGTCHADVEKMNPYGLRTDQLASYWLSGHGKRLKAYQDDHVAVCVDCHGAHDVLSKDNAHSRTHFSNIPGTCARCHADQNLMATYNLSAAVVEQYRQSIHGRNLLERGDAGSPNCATCHGSHAAAPPGFSDVGHVCGKCHQQVADYVLSSVHGRIDVMARCTGCHGRGGNPRNHQIEQATLSPETLAQTYEQLYSELGDERERLHARFVEKIDATPESLRPINVCYYCHGPSRQGPHAEFFQVADQTVLERGAEFTAALRDAQFDYAQTAARVARMAHGVLIVREEAARTEDVKTEVVALYAFLHTFNRPDIRARVQKVKELCQEVNTSLDQKDRGLTWRSRALYPVWGFAVLFFGLMYRKYLALRRAYVRAPGAPAGLLPAAAPLPSRRRLLDLGLRLMGAGAAVALLYPAVMYVLPARKRGGGGEQTSAGKEAGWAPWDIRKVAVGGKPVGVIRTDKGFRAFSLVCTHLGCIVLWNQGGHEFHCPCHAAVFDAAGQVVSGPPPRPLAEYSVAVVQGDVVVKSAS